MFQVMALGICLFGAAPTVPKRAITLSAPIRIATAMFAHGFLRSLTT